VTHMVTYACEDGIAVIKIDNPPVNALSQSVRTEIVKCIDKFSKDDSALIVVIYGMGRLFLGGADISEFGKAPEASNVANLW